MNGTSNADPGNKDCLDQAGCGWL